jgi:hypothetical protein
VPTTVIVTAHTVMAGRSLSQNSGFKTVARKLFRTAETVSKLKYATIFYNKFLFPRIVA